MSLLHALSDTLQTVTFCFPDCGTIPPPIVQVQNVSFRYKDDGPLIYRDLEFGVDLDSRVALVGPNGAGKSTLIKLIAGEVGTAIILHSLLGYCHWHCNVLMKWFVCADTHFINLSLSSSCICEYVKSINWVKQYSSCMEIGLGQHYVLNIASGYIVSNCLYCINTLIFIWINMHIYTFCCFLFSYTPQMV